MLESEASSNFITCNNDAQTAGLHGRSMQGRCTIPVGVCELDGRVDVVSGADWLIQKQVEDNW